LKDQEALKPLFLHIPDLPGHQASPEAIGRAMDEDGSRRKALKKVGAKGLGSRKGKGSEEAFPLGCWGRGRGRRGRRRGCLKALLALFVASRILDYLSTIACLGRGFSELNPFMAYLFQLDVRLPFMTIAPITAFLYASFEFLERLSQRLGLRISLKEPMFAGLNVLSWAMPLINLLNLLSIA
jgi:hypothetical protein